MSITHPRVVATVRIVLGLFILFSGVSGFLAGAEMQGIPAPMVASMSQLWDMGILQMIKTTEIVVGMMLIFGFLPALALLFLAPICIGVIVYNSHVAPQYLGGGIVITVLTMYLGYAYWNTYKALFDRTRG